MSAIEQYTRAHVLTATQEDRGRVPAVLRHEPGASEVTIRLAAPEPQEWRVDRALLERGVCSPARGAEAEGVRVWPCGRAATVVELPGEQGVVVAQFDTTALLRFLGRIHAAATGAPTPAPTGAPLPASAGATPLAPAAAASSGSAAGAGSPAAPASPASSTRTAAPAAGAGVRATRTGARLTRKGGTARTGATARATPPVTAASPTGVTVTGTGGATSRPDETVRRPQAAAEKAAAEPTRRR